MLVVPLSTTASQQQATFSATVARVRVDVIVTDSAGRFVDDLRPEEFVLYEDGVEQRILSTQVVDLAAGRITEFVPDLSRRADLTMRPVPSASMAGDLGAVIFLVDLPGLDRRNKDRFADAWIKLIDETELMGIPRAVYLIDQVGYLRELAPLTLSVDELRGAAQEVRDAPLVRRGVHDQLVRAAADIPGEEALDFLFLNEVRIFEAQERARTRSTFRLLTQFCSVLSAREGRTALVWVTSEVQLAEGGPGTALAAAALANSDPGFVSGTVDRSRGTGDILFSYLSIAPQMSELQRDLHDTANSSNVSIYTLDPRPAREHRSLPLDMRVGNGDLADLLNDSAVQTSLDGLKDALWQAADETGGQAFIGATELDQALRRIDIDTSKFYLLSYEPSAPQGDGEFHTLRVDVRRSGVNVRERRGYVGLTPQDREAQALAAALVLPGAVSAVPVEVRAYRGWSAAGKPIVRLVVAFEQDLGQQQAGPTQVISHQIHAVALDAIGVTVDEINQQLSPRGSVSPRIRSGERPIVYMHDWSLLPGTYNIRVAVRDGTNGEIGATAIDAELPAPSSQWMASDLMLTVADPSGSAQPLMTGWIFSDETLLAYVEVSVGGEPFLSGRILDADGLQPRAILPETMLTEDSVGIHRGAMRIRNVPPGDYILELELADHTDGNTRSFRVPLQVLPG
ncbi:MAG TPA: VWA domain-containing protein [Acidobacteriota bacterium]|jgi:VWFA-related protein|nr:VWA domain-containing protein [Acidobacteriota bacterium]|tara:strand:+ start:178 stop:2226 length:2049 start_codon:yes stop_codon:yes gene_type:complete